jgi:hypothetical protein
MTNLSKLLTKQNVQTAGMILGVLFIFLVVLAVKGGDERIIHRRLSRIRKLMEKEVAEKPLVMIAKNREMMEYLSSTVEMNVGTPLPSTTGRQELLGLINQFRAMAQKLNITIRDRALTMHPDRKSATMRMTVDVEAEAPGQKGREIREIEMIWGKEQAGWVIQKIVLVESIRRPGQ